MGSTINLKSAVGEIVNLRREKQRRARDDAAAVAKQNRVRHGRTKAETRERQAARGAAAGAARCVTAWRNGRMMWRGSGRSAA